MRLQPSALIYGLVGLERALSRFYRAETRFPRRANDPLANTGS